MEGSVLSFLKAERKVSDTDSSHWASSLYIVLYYTITAYGYSVSEVNIFQKSTNQQYELPVVAMFVNGSGRNEQDL
jgi:hypothetical protein